MRKFLVGLATLTAVTTGFVFAADIGPKADVTALRAMAKTPNNTISAVHVVGDYALVFLYTKYITQSPAFKRISGERWKQIMAGAETTMSVSNLIRAGVPASVANQLCSGWGGTPQFPNANSPCMK